MPFDPVELVAELDPVEAAEFISLKVNKHPGYFVRDQPTLAYQEQASASNCSPQYFKLLAA